MQGTIHQALVDRGDQVDLVGRLGGHGCPFGDFEDAVVVFLDRIAVQVTDVVPDLGVCGNDVGRVATRGNHVVDAGAGLDVLAHQVDAVVHQLDGVEGAAAVPGVAGAVGRLAEELHGEAVHGPARLVAGVGLGAGMPVDGDVEIVEKTVAGHVHLAHHGLLRRRTVKADGS